MQKRKRGVHDAAWLLSVIPTATSITSPSASSVRPLISIASIVRRRGAVVLVPVIPVGAIVRGGRRRRRRVSAVIASIAAATVGLARRGDWRWPVTESRVRTTKPWEPRGWRYPSGRRDGTGWVSIVAVLVASLIRPSIRAGPVSPRIRSIVDPATPATIIILAAQRHTTVAPSGIPHLSLQFLDVVAIQCRCRRCDTTQQHGLVNMLTARHIVEDTM